MNDQQTYEAKIISSGLKVASTGTKYISICAGVEQKEGMPKKYFGNLFLTFKTMEKTLKVLRDVFGWEGKEISDFNDPHLLKGKVCDIVTEHDEEFGNDKIVFFNKVYAMDKLKDEELSSLVSDVQPMLDKLLANETPMPEQNQGQAQAQNQERFSDGSPVNEPEGINF